MDTKYVENFITINKDHMPESLALWINKTWSVVEGEEPIVYVQELYDTYEIWCEDNGEEPIDYGTFEDYIEECGQAMYAESVRGRVPVVVFGYYVEDAETFAPEDFDDEGNLITESE